MKITPINFDKIRKQISTNNNRNANFGYRYDHLNPYTVPIIYHIPQIHSIFENYDTAKDIFENNIKQGKGIFGDNSNIEELMDNDRIRRNVVKFFSEYSKEEIDKIDKKKIVSIDELQYREGLKEVNKFFSEFIELWPESELPKDNYYEIPQKMLSFAGNMKPEDEKVCKNIVHGFSAACGGVSAAMGEGAAIGADTPILRTAQFIMFSIMAYYLKVPPVPSAEYYLKEMCQGATLGVGGAKLVTSWLGIAGHAAAGATGTSIATGGGADAAISGGVKAVNGSLSALITEKMGRGYIRRVKENRMTFKDQTLELGSYFLARGVLAHENPLSQLYKVDFKDASNPELIKDAILKMPDGYQKATSGLLKILAKSSLSVGELFVGNFGLTLLATREKDPKKLKKVAGEIFRNSLIQTVSYELANTAVKSEVSKEATETILDMQKNLEKYPEVYRIIINKEHEFFENINIDALKYDEFTNQFTNKVFVNNLSRFCREMIREIQYTWVNRKRDANSKNITDALDKADEASQREKEIDNSITDEEAKEAQEAIDEMKKIFTIQTEYLSAKDNFGYGRIGGYDDIKSALTEILISPLSLKDTSIATPIPNAILFYGPTGVGKTELAKAVAEQGKCKLVPFDDVESVDELKTWLNDKFNEAKNATRHYIIQIDEFDDFCEDDETAKIFEEYINKAQDNNVTFILTTNNPLDINDKILQETINIPVGSAGKKDILGVLKHYTDDFSEQDYIELAQEIQEHSEVGAYSNTQIKNICLLAKTGDGSNAKEKMLELIKSKKPEIRQENIDKFNLEKEQIRNF